MIDILFYLGSFLLEILVWMPYRLFGGEKSKVGWRERKRTWKEREKKSAPAR